MTIPRRSFVARAIPAVLALILAAAPTALADWTHAAPEEHGMDSANIESMKNLIDETDLPIDSVVILRGGEIVFEYFPRLPLYGPDIPHNLYSTTKSITSTLIGIAIEMGFIEDVHQQVIDFFPDREIQNLDDRKRRMTLEHLLTMTSGLEWEGPDDIHHSWGDGLRSGDPVQYALDRPMAYEPGEVWYYNGGCSHVLSAILTEATGMSTLTFARRYLFGPLGITLVVWPSDPNGIYYGGQDIHLSPYAMAKIGQLFLDGGLWEGEQIVPAEWVEASRTSHAATWMGGYGYQWWTYPDSGIYYASGAFEQRIYIAPELDMVVVFTSSNQAPGIGQGERAVGPPVVEWLLSRFILPACDGFEQLAYDAYGVSLSIPHLLDGWTSGGPGVAHASEDAGLVLFSYAGSPYERLGIRWTTPNGTCDPAAALNDLHECLSVLGTQIEEVDPPAKIATAAGPATYQRMTMVQDHGPEIAYFGTRSCDESGLSVVVYLGVAERFIPWIDPLEELTRILESLECSGGE